MSKSVLISIQPKWCELIASGKKSIEVRKTRPKLKPPFKCYIYCTAATQYNQSLVYRYEAENGNIYIDGKHYKEFISAHIIGEFVCDDVIKDEHGEYADVFENCGLLTLSEQKEYGKNKSLYGWHISDLVIYDEPKDIKVFKRWNRTEENAPCAHVRWLYEPCETCTECNLKRPPQSWCYVE